MRTPLAMAGWSLACALAVISAAGCESNELDERHESFGRVVRPSDQALYVTLSSNIKLEAAVNMRLFERTVPDMTRDAAVRAFGQPVGHRVDKYDVVWHKFVVPTGYAEVALAKAGSADGEGVVGWRLYLYPDDKHSALSDVFTPLLVNEVRTLNATTWAEVLIGSLGEQQQVNIVLSNGGVEKMNWVHTEPTP